MKGEEEERADVMYLQITPSPLKNSPLFTFITLASAPGTWLVGTAALSLDACRAAKIAIELKMHVVFKFC
jgi:hypothetical protein